MPSAPRLLSLAADLAAGRTTSLALTEAALARIEDKSGEGGRSFVRVWREPALAAAEAADRLRRLGIVPSPLAGIPVSVKDLFDVAGEPSTAGSTVLADAPPAAADAAVVARLRAAGAALVGRTNMTEFAYSGLGLNPHYGTPANPFDPTRVPGGSSSGAGAAVAYGFSAASIGTDTGGSVRIPAAFNGITGFKPTARRVSRDGVVPLSSSLDSIGPLAASVACCALVDAVLAGEPFEPLPALPLSGLRLAVPLDRLTEGLAPVVAQAFERSLRRLSEAGARITELTGPVFAGLDELARLGGIAGPEALAWHHDLLAKRGAGYDPRVRSRLLASASVSAADYIRASRLRAHLIATFDRVTAPFDAVLAPTVAVPPPRFDEVASEADYNRLNLLVLRNCTTFNLLDRCGVSLPIQQPGELPVGLMVVGETMGDRRLLAVAQAIEAALA